MSLEERFAPFRQDTVQVGDPVRRVDDSMPGVQFRVTAATADTLTVEWRDGNNVKHTLEGPRDNYAKVEIEPPAEAIPADDA